MEEQTNKNITSTGKWMDGLEQKLDFFSECILFLGNPMDVFLNYKQTLINRKKKSPQVKRAK